MSTSRLKITLADAGKQRIKLAKQTTHNITMAAPLSSGGNAYVSIDTTAGWRTRTTYIPRAGEFVIYSDRNVIDGVDYPGVKIGDGLAYAVDLPFLDSDITNDIYDTIQDHIQDGDVHVSVEDRTSWNNKLNCELDGENLVFNRL